MIELGPTLALAIAPLTPPGGDGVRRAVEAAARLGYRAVQLSAAQRGIRPRELDHRARRDLAALLARNSVALAGIDLMIPAEHWADPASLDRAADSALAAVALAADLGRVPVSLTLPIHARPDGSPDTDALPADVLDALVAAADGRGVALAIHAEHAVAALRTTLARIDQPLVGAAIDPALLFALDDAPGPVDAALALAPHLLVARLDDYASAARCPVGAGSLNPTNYRAVLSTCPRLRAIVADVRALPDPPAAAAHTLAAWSRTAGIIG